MLALPASHPLALLDLSGCVYLRVVDLTLAGLCELRLNACRTLYRLRMRCECHGGTVSHPVCVGCLLLFAPHPAT